MVKSLDGDGSDDRYAAGLKSNDVGSIFCNRYYNQGMLDTRLF